MHIRPLKTLDDCARVAELERVVWGYTDAEDVVPAPVLIVSIKRGGILLGAFDDAGTMKGFVYSMAAIKDGRPTQWSHMLGVTPDARDTGIGGRLKVAQRDEALRRGIDLVEWTYDPLQAMNAHLNFAKLGVVVEEYAENLYGESSSPLHRGTPTDRFVAEWHLTRPHVERRIARLRAPRFGEAGGPAPRFGEAGGPAPRFGEAGGPATRFDEAGGPATHVGGVARDATVTSAPVLNPSRGGGEWLRPGRGDLSRDDRRALVEIPTGFGDMQVRVPELAFEWRMTTREVFQWYLPRGYRVVDFFLSREAKRGHYLLARPT